MRARWILMGALALLSVTSGAALAQGRGHGRGRDKSDVPPGQAKKAERQEGRFDDHDQQIARNWYVHARANQDQEHQLPPGLRDRDRLPPGIEKQLARGWVVDRGDRERLYPPPPVLVRRFAPPPPGCRYFVFGGHVVLVDPGYRVLDVIHLELNLQM